MPEWESLRFTRVAHSCYEAIVRLARENPDIRVQLKSKMDMLSKSRLGRMFTDRRRAAEKSGADHRGRSHFPDSAMQRGLFVSFDRHFRSARPGQAHSRSPFRRGTGGCLPAVYAQSGVVRQLCPFASRACGYAGTYGSWAGAAKCGRIERGGQKMHRFFTSAMRMEKPLNASEQRLNG